MTAAQEAADRGAGAHRVLFTLEYDGTDFSGWQIQPNGRSVQEEIERALAAICGVPVRVTGAGRTDAGVHASGQTAHADLITRLDDATLLRAMNAHLPADVVVREIRGVDASFHARYDASSRAYRYIIAHQPVALERRSAWLVHPHLDSGRITAAAALLCGTHDCTSLAKHSADQRHGWCHIFEAVWESGIRFSTFHIRANRFLYGMVRTIVGALVHVGMRRLDPEDLIAIRDASIRDAAIRDAAMGDAAMGDAAIRDAAKRPRLPGLAPPHGLVLTGVHYDTDERAFVQAAFDALRARGLMPPRSGMPPHSGMPPLPT